MVTITDGTWIADLGTMTCRNYANNVIVVFEKCGNALVGKIKDMPIDLLSKWAAKPNGDKRIKNAVVEAEDVFLRAYFESDIENQNDTAAFIAMGREKKEKTEADIAPKLLDTTIIFERPQAVFDIHPDCIDKIYRTTDIRLNDERYQNNPWAFFDIVAENLNKHIATGKQYLMLPYNVFTARVIGGFYRKIRDKLKQPLCITFYHKGEKLTNDDYSRELDSKTTALDSMEYFDFIAKREIPFGYEVTLPIKE